jgi:hypothetical protein
MVCRCNADTAGHVLRNDRWLAGNMAVHVTRNQPSACVIIAAGRGGDDHLHRLAAIEIGDSIGARSICNR